MQKNSLYADRVIRVAVLQWHRLHPSADRNSPDKWIWVAGFLARWMSQHLPVDWSMRRELAQREEQLGVTEAAQQQSIR
jgi:hypothetical protein